MVSQGAAVGILPNNMDWKTLSGYEEARVDDSELPNKLRSLTEQHRQPVSLRELPFPRIQVDQLGEKVGLEVPDETHLRKVSCYLRIRGDWIVGSL
jgi:hypothetical protein